MNSILILVALLGLPAAADESLVLGADPGIDRDRLQDRVQFLRFLGVEEAAMFHEEEGIPETGIDSFPLLGEAGPEFDQDKDKDKDHDHRRDPNAVLFTIGPAAGYLRVRDADRGTWFGGIQARVQFLRYLGVEGSITFHQNRFADGDIVVTQYPVQVTGLFFPFPDSKFSPYGLVGAGWYYTRVDFDSSLGGGEETERLSGWHVGAGAQATLGPRVSAFGDFRWVFIDDPGVDNSNIDEEEFDYWQVTLGLSVGF